MEQSALIIEDHKYWQGAIREILERLNLDVVIVDNRVDARKQLEARQFDLVIVDVKLSGGDLGSEWVQTSNLLRYLQQQHKKTKCILLTGYPTLDYCLQALNESLAFAYFVKPKLNVVDFEAKIKSALNVDDQTEPLSAPPPPILEERRQELYKRADSGRREAAGILIAGRKTRIAMKGGKADKSDDDWLTKRLAVLDDRFQDALSRIRDVGKLEEIGEVQSWLETECSEWLDYAVASSG
jgi:DNA-binding NtrC family response regulator